MAIVGTFLMARHGNGERTEHEHGDRVEVEGPGDFGMLMGNTDAKHNGPDASASRRFQRLDPR